MAQAPIEVTVAPEGSTPLSVALHYLPSILLIAASAGFGQKPPTSVEGELLVCARHNWELVVCNGRCERAALADERDR